MHCVIFDGIARCRHAPDAAVARALTRNGQVRDDADRLIADFAFTDLAPTSLQAAETSRPGAVLAPCTSRGCARRAASR